MYILIYNFLTELIRKNIKSHKLQKVLENKWLTIIRFLFSQTYFKDYAIKTAIFFNYPIK